MSDLTSEVHLEAIDPRQLLLRRGQGLEDIYEKLLHQLKAPLVQKKSEKLWCLFDYALHHNEVDFIHRYLNEVCFSPDLVPLACDAYCHSTRVVLDWSQRVHSDSETKILMHMRSMEDHNLFSLLTQLDALSEILKLCLSKRTADPSNAASRSVLVSRLIHTTQGIRLAAQVAWWNVQQERCLQEDIHLDGGGLPSDSYLASQNLPPLWLEQYPFEDVTKAVEVLFLNKDVVFREELKSSKIALFGFYILHSRLRQSLDFLIEIFRVKRELVNLWEGLFLIDLALHDPYFHQEEIKTQGANALKNANQRPSLAIPIETLVKMQTLGLGSDAKQLFMKHKTTYFQLIDNKTAVARQGLVFCTSSGDLSSGLEICRDAIALFPKLTDGIPLLRSFFDQILGNGKLQDLIMMNFTPFEERLFIDWAGNKRNDPECSLYLTLYFLRRSDIESAQKLHQLHKNFPDQSMHEGLWEEIRLALELLNPDGKHQAIEVMDLDDGGSVDSSEEEKDEDFHNLLEMTKNLLPAAMSFILYRANETASTLLTSFTEPINSSKNLCPLQYLENVDGECEEEVYFDAAEH